MAGETINKEFPDCFPPNFSKEILPQGLPDMQIEVFRVCTVGTISREAFLSSYEEMSLGKKPFPQYWEQRKNKPGSFSVSCNDSIQGGLNPLKCVRRPYPKAFLMCGIASSVFGPMQRTADRIPNYTDKTHIDWWLYKDADPSPGFVEVEVSEENEHNEVSV